MKSFIAMYLGFAALLFVPFATLFAADPQSVINQANSTAYRISQQAYRLSPQQLEQTAYLLGQVESVLNGTVPNPGQRACNSEDLPTMQAAFSLVKDFAYSPSGLDQNSDAARNFAQTWVSRYPCSSAKGYIAAGKSLRAAAYNPEGFDMDGQAASGFTKVALERRCQPNVDYETEARNLYRFAYSPQGLNMSSDEASIYARQQIEGRYLRCSGVIDPPVRAR